MENFTLFPLIKKHLDNLAIWPSLIQKIPDSLDEFFSTKCRKSVSYTHLDVYKRQLQAVPQKLYIDWLKRVA